MTVLLEYRYNKLIQYILVLYCSLQLPLTALLGSIDGIKLHSLKNPPNVLALCWHSTPAYYAFYCTNIFDAGLVTKYYDECSFIHLCNFKHPLNIAYMYCKKFCEYKMDKTPVMTYVIGPAKTGHNRTSLNLQYKVLILIEYSG